MNIIYNKQLLLIVSALCIGLLLANISNVFLKNSPLNLVEPAIKPLSFELDVVSKSSLKSKNAPETQTDTKQVEVILLKEFILKGTIVGSINAAIIGHKGKGEYIYLNENYEGYKLIDVLLDRAIFEKNGQEYTLYLYETMQEVAQTAANSTILKKENKRVIIKGKELFEQIKQKDGNYFIPRVLIKEYMNLDTIFSQIHVVGMFHNNTFTGFLVQRVHPSGIFAKLGLQRGDKIMKINGNSFKSMEEPFVYFNGLDKLSSLSLTIVRKGKEEELKYEIY